MSEENVGMESTEEAFGSSEVVENAETEESTDDTSIENAETENADDEEESIAVDWANLELKNTEGTKKLSELTQEEAKEYFQKGSDYDRKISSLNNKINDYNNNPAYQYIDNYIKESGYDDPAEFIREIKISERAQSYMQSGMSEQSARNAAEEFVGELKSNNSDKEIDEFLAWHSEKVESGKFANELDPQNVPESIINAYKSGTPLKEAYMDYKLDNIKTNTEQNTIKNILGNKNKSTGPIEQSGVKPKTKLTSKQIEKTLDSMSSSDKTKWIDKNYNLIEKSGYFKNF